MKHEWSQCLGVVLMHFFTLLVCRFGWHEGRDSRALATGSVAVLEAVRPGGRGRGSFGLRNSTWLALTTTSGLENKTACEFALWINKRTVKELLKSEEGGEKEWRREHGREGIE